MKTIQLLFFTLLLALASPSFAEAPFFDNEAKYKEFKAEGDKQLQAGNYQKALVAYQEALKNKPKDKYAGNQIEKCEKEIGKVFEKLKSAGDKLFEKGQAEAAVVLYDSALTFFPKDAYLIAQIDKADSQIGSSFTQKIGGKHYEAANHVAKIKEGGYIIAGRTSISGNTDMHLARIDESGKPLWEKNYGDSETEEANAVIECKDGSLVAVGHSDSFGGGIDMKDMWILKIDKDGKQLWAKNIGEDSVIQEANHVVEDEDGNLLVVGNAMTVSEDGKSDVMLIKIDPSGKLIWEKRYGGASNDQANKIVKSAKGYVIVGNTESSGAGSWDVWMFEINKAGEKLWEKTFGGTENEMANTIYATSDGGYLIGGYTYSFAKGSHDAWVIKTNFEGKKLWANVYGGLSTDEAFSIIENKKGQYIIAGYTDDYKPGAVKVNDSKVANNILLIRLKKDGRMDWERSIGGDKDQRAHCVVESNDGGYVLVGYTDENVANGFDVLVIKVNRAGLSKE